MFFWCFVLGLLFSVFLSFFYWVLNVMVYGVVCLFPVLSLTASAGM